MTTKKYIQIFSLINIIFLSLTSCTKTNKTTRNAVNFKDSDSLIDYISTSNNNILSDKRRYQIIDSSLLFIKIHPNISDKKKVLSKISYSLRNLNDSLRFREINNQLLNLSKTNKDSTGIANAYWDLGYFFYVNKINDSAFYNYNKAQDIFTNLDSIKSTAVLKYTNAVLQREVGDFLGSEVNTINAIKEFRKIKAYDCVFDCYNNLGAISTSLGANNRAIDYYNKANIYLDSFQSSNYERLLTINNIGVSYKNLGEFENALINFNKILESDSLKNTNPNFYSKVLTNVATTKAESNSSDNLKPLYQEAITTINENDFLKSTIYSHFATYLASKNEQLSAIYFSKNARKLSIKTKNTASLLRSLELLSKIDKPNSSKHAQEYILLTKRLQQEERDIKDKFARIRFETDEFIKENELLDNRNKLLSKEKQLWTSIAITFLIVASAVIIIILLRIKNNDLKFKQNQQEKNQEIFNLLMQQQGKFQEGKKLEQERISQELHDGVLNKMLGIRLVLTGLNKRNDPESVQQRSELIKELAALSEEIRTVSHELNSASYQKVHNFIEAIKTLVKTFRLASPEINYNFIYCESLDWDNIDSDIKINLYRILQETIQNSVKHAKAKNIFINFEATESEISVIIEDNGIGFDQKKQKNGIGIKNISSRIKKIKGEWTIKSNVNTGTTITLKIPYHTVIDNKSIA
jgi:signal transduction histidine kinase